MTSGSRLFLRCACLTLLLSNMFGFRRMLSSPHFTTNKLKVPIRCCNNLYRSSNHHARRINFVGMLRAYSSQAGSSDLINSNDLLLQQTEPIINAANNYHPINGTPSDNTALPGTITSVSFFSFRPIDDEAIDAVIAQTKQVLANAQLKGTLILSNEGYNGQFAVPHNDTSAEEELQAFTKILQGAHPIFDDLSLNVGDTVDYRAQTDIEFPYRKLIVRRKKEILTDGLHTDQKLDWTDAGPQLTPEQWHMRVAARVKSTHGDKLAPLLIDCRNAYESDMGTFESAVPLRTEVFSESWHALEELLAEESRDREVLTFCTGGIRCVKTNAFLRQRLGFKNVYRLQKGIVAYENWAKDAPTNTDSRVEELGDHDQASNDGDSRRGNTDQSAQAVGASRTSLFKGKNFLFDRRRL